MKNTSAHKKQEKPNKTFIKRFQAGEIKNTTEEFFKEVENHRKSGSTVPVWEYLGISEKNYNGFVEASNKPPCMCGECRWRRSPW